MIGIIGAMDIEVKSIESILSDTKEEIISGIRFVSGHFSGKDIVVAKCGVGKVFAGICAEAMILSYLPDLIINVGVAGCLDETLKIGDIVIADNVVQHDMDTSAAGDQPGMLSGINIIEIPTDKTAREVLCQSAQALSLPCCVGIIASGDQFVANNERKAFIKSTFGAKSCEMEGAAIGQVCYVNNIAFSVLRAISDGADDSADMDYPSFVRLAAKNSTNVIKEFLTRI